MESKLLSVRVRPFIYFKFRKYAERYYGGRYGVAMDMMLAGQLNQVPKKLMEKWLKEYRDGEKKAGRS